MGTLVIEDVDDALMGELARLASENHVQIEAQARQILHETVLAGDRRNLAARLDAIAAMTPKGVDQTHSLDMLREDRAR